MIDDLTLTTVTDEDINDLLDEEGPAPFPYFCAGGHSFVLHFDHDGDAPALFVCRTSECLLMASPNPPGETFEMDLPPADVLRLRRTDIERDAALETAICGLPLDIHTV